MEVPSSMGASPPPASVKIFLASCSMATIGALIGSGVVTTLASAGYCALLLSLISLAACAMTRVANPKSLLPPPEPLRQRRRRHPTGVAQVEVFLCTDNAEDKAGTRRLFRLTAWHSNRAIGLALLHVLPG
jgi:hypothetical protein